MIWPSKVFAAVEQRANSIPEGLREGSGAFSCRISMAKAKQAFDDGRCDVGVGKDEPLRTKSGTKLARVWRSLEVTSILVARTLSNIGLVKLVDALLDAVHH